MGLWEGVPLREVVWLTQPQGATCAASSTTATTTTTRSSSSAARCPSAACWRTTATCRRSSSATSSTAAWLDGERGGPVRVVVPEAYGFKSIKWLNRVILTNLAHANDTYADGNNDIDSPLKTFAATLSVPAERRGERADPRDRLRPGRHLRPVEGPGVGQPEREAVAGGRPLFPRGPVARRPHPARRRRSGAASCPGDRIPKGTLGFDPDTGAPRTWPMRLAKVHWAALLPGLPAGDYTLRCRTVDAKGHGQPMPRPFRKSGHCEIEAVKIGVKG